MGSWSGLILCMWDGVLGLRRCEDLSICHRSGRKQIGKSGSIKVGLRYLRSGHHN